MRQRNIPAPLLAVVTLFACSTSWAQTSAAPDSSVPPAAPPATIAPEPDPPPPPSTTPEPAEPGLLSDIKAYYTAPVHWDRHQWGWFGGALIAIGAAHHYDTQVRTHFVKSFAPGQTIKAHDVEDAAPAVAVLAATWGYATLVDDSDGRQEAWNMLEAAGLGGVTAYALKYGVGRQGPDQTSNANEWRKSGGRSFPSFHATVAFAVGTVLAESGNDDYRWLRRLLGYGMGGVTSYLRLKHNQHWLSDTVAGAALGAASARFTLNRSNADEAETSLIIEPLPGGAMLTWRRTLR